MRILTTAAVIAVAQAITLTNDNDALNLFLAEAASK